MILSVIHEIINSEAVMIFKGKKSKSTTDRKLKLDNEKYHAFKRDSKIDDKY